MVNDSILEMVNKMIAKAEDKLCDAIRKHADQNAVLEIKRLITYLKERQKELMNNNEH